MASLGNMLGAVVNWALSRGIRRFHDRARFPASPEPPARARRGHGRYGKWSVLLSWVPVVGAALTVAAGLMREPLPVLLLLVGRRRRGRYVVVWGAMAGELGGREAGLCGHRPRGAYAITEENTVVWCREHAAFARMAKRDLDGAAAFHQFIICGLTDRLVFANAATASLER